MIVRDLIKSSLRLLSVVGAGENMTAEDATDSLAALNQMLASWSSDGQVIYSRSVDTFTLIGGQQTYTMGPSGDINTPRPVSITNATLTLGGVVTPIQLWAQNTFSVLSFPSLQGGIPYEMFINNGSPLLTLQLFPIPSGGQTLTIYSLKPMSNLTLNDNLDLPPGYERALKYNLAVEVAPEYEREPSSTVKDIAKTSYGVIVRTNQQYFQPTMVTDAILLQDYYNNWGFNISGGY